MAELVSVIVPVYNVAPYLERCVQSILEQTYSNLEVILVDDGSTDNSNEMCDKLGKKDGRIHVLHQRNIGLAGARNAGIQESSGNFILFVDSDDWIEADIIRKALLAYHQTKAEIIVWGYYSDYVDQYEKLIHQEKVPASSEILVGNIKTNNVISDDFRGILGYAWNKLYTKDVIGSVIFPVGISLTEDVIFNTEIYLRNPLICVIPDVGNHYIQRKRETLGTTYHSKYYYFLSLAKEQWKKLLYKLNATEEQKMYFLSKYEFKAICWTVSGISKDNKMSLYQRYKKIKEFLNIKDLEFISENIIPSSLKEKVVSYLLLKKLSLFLLFVYK